MCGVKKFHNFSYARSFALVTDHKPLLAVLGPKRGVTTLAAAPMQRGALILRKRINCNSGLLTNTVTQIYCLDYT